MVTKLNRQRLDKWLWAARFFKTRALAIDAIKHNQVQVNGQRAKPSRNVVIGDRLTIEKGNLLFEVMIEGLNEQRRPAVEAQQLYNETEASITGREETKELRRMMRLSAPKVDEGKPTKQARRERIKQKYGCY